MLGPIWTVLNHYATSMKNVVIGNVGIPIEISFSLAEDSDIYNDFSYYLKNIYGYNITDGAKYTTSILHMEQVSLGASKYSQQIRNRIAKQTLK